MQGSTLKQLQQQLRSANAETRRQAAEQLGQVKDGRAVEALIAALTGGERDWSVLYAVATALEDIADPWAVPALVEALWHHQDEFVRALAAGTLGKIGDTRAVEPLARALQEGGGVEGMMVRGAAAWALGEIGGAQAVEALIAHLEWGDKFEVLCNVVYALGKIGGAQAVEPLARALGRVEDVVRRAVAETLVAMGGPQVVEALVRVLEEATSAVQQIGATTFRRIGVLRGAGSLLETLHEEATSAVQQRGITALRRVGGFGGASLLPSLQDIEEEPILSLVWTLNNKESVMRSAAWALGQLGNARAVEALIAALARNGPWETGFRAVDEAREHGRDIEAVELVRALEQHAQQEALRVGAAASALGNIGDPRAVEPLVEVLKEATSAAQQIAATALGKIGDLGAVESVLEALFDWEVEWAAQWRTRREVPTIPLGGSGDDGEDEGERSATRIPLLEDIGDARAVLQLVRALDDAEGVVSSVAWALGNIGDPRATEALIAALARNEQWEALQRAVAKAHWNIAVAREGAEARENHVQVRGTVAEALGRIGDARAVEPLASVLQDQGWRVRQAAFEALTGLGQQVPQPDHCDTCPTCAAEVVRPGDRFCLNCGTPVGVVGEQTKQPEERKTL